MRKLEFKLDRKSLEIIYTAFIRPILEYENIVWDNCAQYEKEELELKIQHEAARIATGNSRLVSLNLLYQPEEIKWDSLQKRYTVVTAFFMSTETHAKRFLTVWKRSVSTTLKRSFTVLANQIIVSETFQAFQILTNHISVRKTLSWKPCLVSNVLAFAELANQNPADSIYFTSFFFFFFFFFFFSNFT